MPTTTTGKVTYLLPLSITTLALSATDLGEQMELPQEPMALERIASVETGYSIGDEGSFALAFTQVQTEEDKLQAISQFASTIVRESRDLELDIVEALNRDFWELV